MSCFWKVLLHQALPSTSRKKPLGFFIRMLRATSTISESEGSVRLFLFNSYCMSPGSKRPVGTGKSVGAKSLEPAGRTPKKPGVSQRIQNPYAQLGANVGKRDLTGRLCGSRRGLSFHYPQPTTLGAQDLQPTSPGARGLQPTAPGARGLQPISPGT